MDSLNLKLYDTLRKELNLDEEKSRAITQAIEETLETNKSEIVTKDFVEKKISEAKNDIIKWVAVLIIGQTALLVALIKLLAK